MNASIEIEMGSRMVNVSRKIPLNEMNAKALNLTWVKVNKEFDNLVIAHHSLTYKILLKNPGFRKSLLDYVLSKIPNHFLFLESDVDHSLITRIVKSTPHERLTIYQLVHQRISQLRRNKVASRIGLKQVY